MSDLINRATLLKKLMPDTDRIFPDPMEDKLTRYQLIHLIESMPSAEPEHKTGAWRHYEGMLTCQNCNAEFYDDICDFTGNDFPRFCPACGTEMRGEENEAYRNNIKL